MKALTFVIVCIFTSSTEAVPTADMDPGCYSFKSSIECIDANDTILPEAKIELWEWNRFFDDYLKTVKITPKAGHPHSGEFDFVACVQEGSLIGDRKAELYLQFLNVCKHNFHIGVPFQAVYYLD